MLVWTFALIREVLALLGCWRVGVDCGVWWFCVVRSVSRCVWMVCWVCFVIINLVDVLLIDVSWLVVD